jgi:hypothetical protein
MVMATMFCKKCGVQVAEGKRFCRKCGHQVLQPNPPAATPASVPASAISSIEVVQAQKETSIQGLRQLVQTAPAFGQPSGRPAFS